MHNTRENIKRRQSCAHSQDAFLLFITFSYYDIQWIIKNKQTRRLLLVLYKKKDFQEKIAVGLKMKRFLIANDSKILVLVMR